MINEYQYIRLKKIYPKKISKKIFEEGLPIPYLKQFETIQEYYEFIWCFINEGKCYLGYINDENKFINVESKCFKNFFIALGYSIVSIAITILTK